uniref:Uncharacterized protein n=1 Tax=Caenorhabditis japonica TaxID=281687 RepID=A0A8R1EJ25_CAEJA
MQICGEISRSAKSITVYAVGHNLRWRFIFNPQNKDSPLAANGVCCRIDTPRNRRQDRDAGSDRRAVGVREMVSISLFSQTAIILAAPDGHGQSNESWQNNQEGYQDPWVAVQEGLEPMRAEVTDQSRRLDQNLAHLFRIEAGMKRLDAGVERVSKRLDENVFEEYVHQMGQHLSESLRKARKEARQTSQNLKILEERVVLLTKLSLGHFPAATMGELSALKDLMARMLSHAAPLQHGPRDGNPDSRKRKADDSEDRTQKESSCGLCSGPHQERDCDQFVTGPERAEALQAAGRCGECGKVVPPGTTCQSRHHPCCRCQPYAVAHGKPELARHVDFACPTRHGEDRHNKMVYKRKNHHAPLSAASSANTEPLLTRPKPTRPPTSEAQVAAAPRAGSCK